MNAARLRRGVLDTEILIGIRSGDNDAYLFALDVLKAQPIDMSELSAMVLISRCLDLAELQALLGFLDNCQVHALSARVSKRALAILQALPPPSVLSPADAIIAATALIHKLPLYALDPGRFGIVPGLNCIQPY